MHHLFDRDSLPKVHAPYVALVHSSDSTLSVHVFGPAAEFTAERSASNAVDQPLTLKLGKTWVGRAWLSITRHDVQLVTLCSMREVLSCKCRWLIVYSRAVGLRSHALTRLCYKDFWAEYWHAIDQPVQHVTSDEVICVGHAC